MEGVYLVVINTLAFLAMGVDKWQAIRQRRRISEATLHLFSLAGGPFGILLGMGIFRHKVRKWPFWPIPVMTAIFWLWRISRTIIATGM